MAEDEKQDQSAGAESGENLEEAMGEATGDTLKVPHEEESEPANTEGSESKLP